jgi:hypothetical protein
VHSDVSKKCLALWRRIDFQILGVKINVLEFDKNFFFAQHLLDIGPFFFHGFSGFVWQLCPTLQGRHLADTVLGAFASHKTTRRNTGRGPTTLAGWWFQPL